MAVDVHGTAATDTLTTTSSEGQSGINLVLDADEGVQDHGSGLAEVEGVGLQAWLLAGGIGAPSVDLEGLQLGLSSGRL